jgi:hypothetical protein
MENMMTDIKGNGKLDIPGQRLRALRAKIVASGEPLLTAEAIEQEIGEQRDRFKELDEEIVNDEGIAEELDDRVKGVFD